MPGLKGLKLAITEMNMVLNYVTQRDYLCLPFVGEVGFTAVEIQYEGDEPTLATVSL